MSEIGVGVAEQIEYFARLRPGDAQYNPSWLLRRAVIDGVARDELLEPRDGQWRVTGMLAAAERGELPGELRSFHPTLAAAQVMTVQRAARVAARAVARQSAGEFMLRRATDAVWSDRGVLDDEQRADYVEFLAGAPEVGVGSYRTDGMWVWPDSLAAAVQSQSLPPRGTLDLHLQERIFLLPEAIDPSVLARARALVLVEATPEYEDEPVYESVVPGAPTFPTKAERSAALARWHAEWSDRHAESTPFRPEQHKGESDYNLHHVDIEASADAEAEFQRGMNRIMGWDPETGSNVDL